MTAPRIGIDARKARDFGIGTYTRTLVRGLAEIGPELEFVLFIRPADQELFADLPLGFRTVPTSARPYSIAELTRFADRVRREKLDLFHALHYVVPPAIGARRVVTIHDLIHLTRPEQLAGPVARFYARLMLKRAVLRPEAVIAVSQSTRRELLDRFGLQADRVDVIAPAADPRFQHPVSESEILRVRAARSLPERFAFFLGGARPHKNLARVREAFARARARGFDGTLVLAGPMPADDSRPEDAVVRLGIVPERDLPAIYAAATFLLYPTLAEGFCLPVLEAMACGTPVIAAEIPAIRELAGDAARLVDPLDAEGIAGAILELSADDLLRATLSRRGLERARDFSPAKTARATLAVYERVLAA